VSRVIKRAATGPKKVERLFKKLKSENRCGLIAYVTCGDPDPETTARIVLALTAAGADAIELGVPFSDPIADGPVIQEASQRALDGGTTTDDLFMIAQRVRMESSVPLIAFSYLNPVLRYGIESFARRCSEAAIDLLLCTDLPPESSKEIRELFHKHHVGIVSLLAPTSPDSRVKLVDRASDGFVYYVSTTGVTGTRRDLDGDLVARLDELRGKIKNPLAVGFGVSTHAHYTSLAPHCDAVVVGSAIVRAIASGDAASAPERAATVVREILGR
jgi:tryptophan synthase alpha chain